MKLETAGGSSLPSSGRTKGRGWNDHNSKAWQKGPVELGHWALSEKAGSVFS